MGQKKLYKYIPEKERELLSINYLLANKIIVDWKGLDIESREVKESSHRYNNQDYFCTIFYKHISCYLTNAEHIKIIKL